MRGPGFLPLRTMTGTSTGEPSAKSPILMNPHLFEPAGASTVPIFGIFMLVEVSNVILFYIDFDKLVSIVRKRIFI